jgi:predicted glycosyltransferase
LTDVGGKRSGAGCPRRLLFYCQDGAGLGHLRRALNIGREVLVREPRCAVLVIGDSPAIPLLTPPAGMDFVKLPTVVRTGPGDWRTRSLALDVDRTLRLRARLIAEAFSGFRPDAVLVDHMPLGAQGELRPMLERAAEAPGVRLYLGLRDVLDAPDVIRRVWRELGAYDYLPAYDAVLVYGCRHVYDVGTVYGLNGLARRLAYCTYATSIRRASRQQPTTQPIVVAMGGGGGDAFPLLRAFVDGFPAVGSRKLRGLVLAGPNMPARDRRLLATAAAPQRVDVVRYVDEPRRLIGRAAAVLCMAGYNTLCEVLAARRRALVVPRTGPSAEQRIRSRLFAERRLVRPLAPEELTPERLGSSLAEVLDDDLLPDEAMIPSLSGAARAAELVLGEAA